MRYYAGGHIVPQQVTTSYNSYFELTRVIFMTQNLHAVYYVRRSTLVLVVKTLLLLVFDKTLVIFIVASQRKYLLG